MKRFGFLAGLAAAPIAVKMLPAVSASPTPTELAVAPNIRAVAMEVLDAEYYPATFQYHTYALRYMVSDEPLEITGKLPALLRESKENVEAWNVLNEARYEC